MSADEKTLRKAGSKTAPYSVVHAMLDAGNPPGTMAELLAVSAKVETGLRTVAAASTSGYCENMLPKGAAPNPNGPFFRYSLIPMFASENSEIEP